MTGSWFCFFFARRRRYKRHSWVKWENVHTFGLNFKDYRIINFLSCDNDVLQENFIILRKYMLGILEMSA